MPSSHLTTRSTTARAVSPPGSRSRDGGGVAGEVLPSPLPLRPAHRAVHRGARPGRGPDLADEPLRAVRRRSRLAVRHAARAPALPADRWAPRAAQDGAQPPRLPEDERLGPVRCDDVRGVLRVALLPPRLPRSLGAAPQGEVR